MLRTRHWLGIAILTASASLGACGGEETAPTNSTEYAGDDKVFPKETTLAGVEAFLNSGTYKSAPWVSDPAVRAAESSHLPKVRVFFNPEAEKSVTAGNSASPSSGSMIVKELYDDAGTLLGVAASLQPAKSPTASSWVYYCKGPEANCGVSNGTSATTPYFETGSSDCKFCHGGGILAKLP